MIQITDNIEGWRDLWYYPDCDEVCENHTCNVIFKFRKPKASDEREYGMAFCLQHLISFVTNNRRDSRMSVILKLKEFLKDHPEMVIEL